jgi:hypothetical protein
MLYVRSRFRHGPPIQENNSALKPCSRSVQHTGICSTTVCCLILTFIAVRTSNVWCIKIQLSTNQHFHKLKLTTKHCVINHVLQEAKFVRKVWKKLAWHTHLHVHISVYECAGHRKTTCPSLRSEASAWLLLWLHPFSLWIISLQNSKWHKTDITALTWVK